MAYEEFLIIGQLSEKYSNVYQACRYDTLEDCSYIYKIFPELISESDIRLYSEEIELTKKSSELGVGAEYITDFYNPDMSSGILITRKLNNFKTLTEKFIEEKYTLSKEDTLKLFHILLELIKNGIIYKDFHTGNIMIDNENNIKLIDFGYPNVGGVQYHDQIKEIQKAFELYLTFKPEPNTQIGNININKKFLLNYLKDEYDFTPVLTFSEQIKIKAQQDIAIRAEEQIKASMERRKRINEKRLRQKKLKEEQYD
jgi:serine/threonine protein kinase